MEEEEGKPRLHTEQLPVVSERGRWGGLFNLLQTTNLSTEKLLIEHRSLPISAEGNIVQQVVLLLRMPDMRQLTSQRASCDPKYVFREDSGNDMKYRHFTLRGDEY